VGRSNGYGFKGLLSDEKKDFGEGASGRVVGWRCVRARIEICDFQLQSGEERKLCFVLIPF
jgi:hypothetical protein